MAESGKGVTSFKLKFPANRDFIVGDIENIEQRSCLYIGQCVEILCFAINNDVNANEVTLQKWSKHIYSLQAFNTASGYLGEGIDVRDTENVRENIGQSHVNHERSCRPFTGGISDDIKGTWETINERLLVYKATVSLENVISSCIRCKVEMVLWSSGIEDDIDSNDANKGFEETHFSRHIVSEIVPVCSPPDVRCRIVSSAGKHNLFVKVTNSLATENMLEIDLLKIHSQPTENSLPQSPDESSSHTDSKSPTSPRTEPYTIESSHMKKLPFTLKPLESTTLPFVVKLNETAEIFDMHRDSYLYVEMNWRLQSAVAWTTSYYRLGNLHIRKPGLVVTAVPQSQPKCKEVFKIKYAVTNNLQDFLSLKLVWSPEKALKDPRACQESYRRSVEQVIKSVICHNPTVELGESHVGSTCAVEVDFHINDIGLYELGQHMKLNLQYAVANPGYTIYSAYNNNNTGGHQRKGSISSIQSMPTEQGSQNVTQSAPRSHSMTPIQPQGLPRRGSTVELALDCIQNSQTQAHTQMQTEASMRSLSSVATPTECSPVHQSHPTFLANSAPPATLTRALSGVQQTFTTHQRSLSQISSPGAVRPPALGTTGITAQQVLKRNCQVFVAS